MTSLTLACFLLSAGQASADWQFTRWGMKLQAIGDAAQKHGMLLQPTSDKEKDSESVHNVYPIGAGKNSPKYDLEADLKGEWTAYPGAVVFFLFDHANSLRRIKLHAPRKSCAKVRSDLRSELGNPSTEVDQNSPGGRIRTEWATRRDAVFFEWSHDLQVSPDSNTYCTVGWRQA